MHLMFSSWAQPPSPTVIDRIEAVVEGRPITLSDVELEKSLARLSPSVFSPFDKRLALVSIKLTLVGNDSDGGTCPMVFRGREKGAFLPKNITSACSEIA